MTMDPVLATVAEAAILTGRSKSRIYRLIETSQLDTYDGTRGLEVRMLQLRRVLDAMVRGRPKGTSKHG
ncbi:hypothetical protein [Subtercola sp. RTI3]|uniref:hypothetical protein n=1 Tax=Subtercola sp. RTI3 TaxID=3048639 RepID=UPI002B223A98|nr:hypothetical protein [Subtercola sp. RTI3]MEA9983661.1 hypothetical protein [Subtercola sp. RTI3]